MSSASTLGLNLLIVLCLGHAPSAAAGEPLVGPTKAGTARAKLPEGVTPDFVITPFGFFHQSCVHRVETGEALLGDGSVRKLDGTVVAARQCAFPHYRHDGKRLEANERPVANEKLSPSAQPLSTTSGWVAAGGPVTWQPVTYFQASWIVPNTPTAVNGQTIFFFPGAEPADAGDIIQPVLGFNGFNTNQWTLSSWDCCKNGNVNYSPPLVVMPGDYVWGIATGSNCDAQGVCANWRIDSDANGPNTYGRTTFFSTSTKPYIWPQGGALEEYFVDNCAQYPASNVTFSNVYFTNAAGANIYDATRPYFWPMAGSPSCNFAVTTDGAPGLGRGSIAPLTISYNSPWLLRAPASVAIAGSDGDTFSSIVTLTNTGTAPVSGISASLEKTSGTLGGLGFGVNSCVGNTLAVNASCTIELLFTAGSLAYGSSTSKWNLYVDARSGTQYGTTVIGVSGTTRRSLGNCLAAKPGLRPVCP